METLKQQVASELEIGIRQVSSVLSLLSEGNTIPFIARYRKEMTNGLDEVKLYEIEKRWGYIVQLQGRKEDVIRIIAGQGKLTAELEEKINSSVRLQEIEDLYRPYKKKKRTRAMIAIENGLEPFAEWVLKFEDDCVEEHAKKFITNKVLTGEEALQGVRDIIAEKIADDPEGRNYIRKYTFQNGEIVTEVKDEGEDENKVYGMYYEYSERLIQVATHRILAMNRGEKAGVLKVAIEVAPDAIENFLRKRWIVSEKVPAAKIVEEAMLDSYKRLVAPAVERDIRKELSEKAEDQAIYIFSENLRSLLLQAPLRGKTVLGVDPAYRTGCKWAVVDQTGKMINVGTVYPHAPKNLYGEAKRTLVDVCKQYKIELIAVGNGTASRETEQLVVEVLRELEGGLSYGIINEAGASVYSASEVAREEFPKLQVEERSAVSIARRLQDPLAELVKIDPKSVGVGQYQHDVSGKKLQDSLKFVVETVVNQVGVNVNTASVSLLQHVSGLSKVAAKNIVKKREEEGSYQKREQLKKIPRIGAKTYEQAIGFLRIVDGSEPLDKTPIHPEHYKVVEDLLNLLGLSKNDLGTDRLRNCLQNQDLTELSVKLKIGEMTFIDIINALKQPERDVRGEFSGPKLRSDVLKISDLTIGMELQGVVRNVVDFGAFIDIGVKQDGLVHISKMSKKRIKHPLHAVSLGQVVTVWIESIDSEKGRISLSLLPLVELIK